MIATKEHLGIGIYTPAEAAFYARVPARIMTRWVFGNSAGKPVISRQIKDTGEKIVTFLDFVQTLAVREVRYRYGLPLQKIREAVEKARSHYRLDYPLAQKHRIFFFGDDQVKGRGDIVIRLEDDDEGVEDQYVQLTGRARGNLMMKSVVEMFLRDLSFDPETCLATQYRPMVVPDAAVLLDPQRRFGEPVVEPGGYTVEALWDATNAEGSIEGAAAAYGVSIAEVELANKYFDMLASDAA
jgi:uncharacterized protein (DUF433 family)